MIDTLRFLDMQCNDKVKLSTKLCMEIIRNFFIISYFEKEHVSSLPPTCSVILFIAPTEIYYLMEFIRRLTDMTDHIIFCNRFQFVCLFVFALNLYSTSSKCPFSWFQPLFFLLLAVISHITKLHIWIWRYKKHTTSIGCWNGSNFSQHGQ